MQSAKFVPTVKPVTSAGVSAAGWADFLAAGPRSVSLVYGAPGVGKTTLLAQKFKTLVKDFGLAPEQILVLAATRESAALLRDRLVFELADAVGGSDQDSPMAVAVEGAMARTVASLAFAIVRQHVLANELPQPELISGAEQDSVLRGILNGEAGQAASEYWPAQVSEVTRTLGGFRTELRDLIASCQEQGLGAGDLFKMAQGSGSGVAARPEWQAASLIFAAYEQWLGKPENRNRFDSAGLVNRAVEIYEKEAGVEPFAAVLVDDAQELTPSSVRLITALLGKDAGLVCFGDPDASTLGFRQANPALMTDLVSSVAASRGAVPSVLSLTEDPWGKPAGTAKVQRKIASLIGVAGSGAHRVVHGLGARTAEGSEPTQVIAKVLSSQQVEIDWLSYQLRELHLVKGVAWQDMAVIARTRQQLDALERALSAQSVPVRVAGAQQAFREEFASRELLELASHVASGSQPSPEVVDRLLRSPFCGLDSIGIRRLRRGLRKQEISGTEPGAIARNSDELLVELFVNPASAESLRGPEASKLRAFLRNLKRAGEILNSGDSTVEDLLWQLWQASNLATVWGEAARGQGEVATQANRNLDAIVGLFAAANRFVERNPGRPAMDFLDQQLQQAIPEDSLTLGRTGKSMVSLVTPASLVGRRFDVVAIPQLIEGVWPNLKPRNSLLGANLVSSLAAALSAESGSPAAKSAQSPLQPRLEIADELRMFYKAIGAANSFVFVSSYADPDEQVSQFLAHVTGGEIPEEEDFELPALTLRGMAGNLRRTLATETNSLARARLAVDLGRLAEAGVPGAHPDDWFGLADISTTEPLFEFVTEPDPEGSANQHDRGERITLNPSQLEAFLKCPLHWFLNYHGAASSDFSASIGTLVHKALELSKSPSEAELWSYVEGGWHSLNFESEWLEQAERRRAQKLVANLSKYLSDFESTGASVVAREQEFDFQLGQAQVRGKVDRIEQLSDGTVVIVDLKTGRSMPTGAETQENPQLGLYQLAYRSGAFDEVVDSKASALGGAKLLLVAGDSTTIRKQSSIDDSQELQALFTRMVEDAAAGMAMPENVFIANVSDHCDAENEFGTCRIHLARAVSYAE